MRLSRFAVGVLLGPTFFAGSCWAQTSAERVVIDARAPGRPFPHFWEQTFGSGRAILTKEIYTLYHPYPVSFDDLYQAMQKLVVSSPAVAAHDHVEMQA
jgi:hypothetical protein